MGNAKRNYKPLFFILYIAFFLLLFLPLALASFMIAKENVGERVESGYDPLHLTGVTVTRRGSAYQEYSAYDGYCLYEVVLSYTNESWYAADRWDKPSFIIESRLGEEMQAMEAWLECSSNLRSEAGQATSIPAGKAGERRYMLEISDDISALQIKETKKKLTGEKQEVTIPLPSTDKSTNWKEE